MSKTDQQSTSGSISTIREFLFCFGKSEGFWSKTLSGFSHCFVGELLDDDAFLVLFEPLFKGAVLDVMLNPFEFEEDLTILRVKIKSINKNRLIKPTFQTCSTLVQYVAGINLGPITPQGLYEALTLMDAKWLKRRGVLEVKSWEM